MQILGLLGMYFDAAVVFVTSQTLLFRLALTILCFNLKKKQRKIVLISAVALKGQIKRKNARSDIKTIFL